MANPTKAELLVSDAGAFDADSLEFVGLRGDPTKHLDRAALERALADSPPEPLDEGVVHLMVARGPLGERQRLDDALLTVEGGMPGDRWLSDTRHGPTYQLSCMQTGYARVVANGQPLELHGDNLYLGLDLSERNLPVGSLVRLGEALLRLTPQAHNGCKKWVQRFGLPAMQLNLAPSHRALHLRGLYFRVVEDGRARVGDSVRVVERG